VLGSAVILPRSVRVRLRSLGSVVLPGDVLLSPGRYDESPFPPNPLIVPS